MARKVQQSCFVVLRTIREDGGWSPPEVLEACKAHPAVVWMFPIIDDPERVWPVYLENPDCVEVFGNLLKLAVLVSTEIERQERRALADADEPMR